MIKKKFHNVMEALVANNVVINGAIHVITNGASHVVTNVITNGASHVVTNVEVIVRVAALVKMRSANFKQLVIVFIL
jgi:3-deoxy-D-manno-octulosonic-acid transferase